MRYVVLIKMGVAMLVSALKNYELHATLEHESWDKVAIPRDWEWDVADYSLDNLGYTHHVD